MRPVTSPLLSCSAASLRRVRYPNAILVRSALVAVGRMMALRTIGRSNVPTAAAPVSLPPVSEKASAG